MGKFTFSSLLMLNMFFSECLLKGSFAPRSMDKRKQAFFLKNRVSLFVKAELQY